MIDQPISISSWDRVANDALLIKTVSALEKNGFTVSVVKNREEAKEKALSLIPEGAEVMTMTSLTLQQAGIDSAINESGKYDALHPKLIKMDREVMEKEIKKFRSVPDFAIGSVHAITADGKIFIASGTGSQLPAYVYGAKKVIWVVGIQKLVKDMDAGFKRLYEYVLPLESERINKVYNITSGSSVNRLLIYNKEMNKDRIHIILVKENLGF